MGRRRWLEHFPQAHQGAFFQLPDPVLGYPQLPPDRLEGGSGVAHVALADDGGLTPAQAGVAAGLPEELAMTIARATVAGSGELAARSTEPAAVLRKNVTSPNGTTQAALEVLMAEDGIQPLFDRAIAAATARSRELAS